MGLANLARHAGALADAIAKAAWDRGAEIGEGFLRAATALRESGLGGAPLLDRAAVYYALSIPCPFLAGEGCSAHATRPLARRGHLVSSPRACCAAFADSSIDVVAASIPLGEVLSEVTGAWLGGKEMIPLPRMLEWLAEATDLAQRTWDASMALDRLVEACLARLG
jgi:hypothetical protein